ncbi:MAG: hypothetical protein VKJ09_01045 [Leptolyngbya sp.]|nr:hypothetical protein [Leptolyngbya sp.]
MTPETITQQLRDRFGAQVDVSPPDAWQVTTTDWRLLVLLSADQSWLRLLVPIVPAPTAEPFWGQILAANFDLTQEVRYALHENVLWGVFQHDRASLTTSAFEAALDRLLALKQQGIDPFFNTFLEQRLRQIIQVAKAQGQTLTETLQTLDRFYSEGLMGDMDGDGTYQTQALTAWQRQLERLWPEVEP